MQLQHLPSTTDQFTDWFCPACRKAEPEMMKAYPDSMKRAKEPTPDDIRNAVGPLGVTYRPLNYSDVNAGVLYFQAVVAAFRMQGTPAMVVYNRKTKRAKVQNGTRDLTYPHILMSVSGVAPS